MHERIELDERHAEPPGELPDDGRFSFPEAEEMTATRFIGGAADIEPL